MIHHEYRYDFNKNRSRWDFGSPWGPTPSSKLSRADSNRVLAELYDWPVVGTLLKTHAMMNAADQYLSDHGLTWADVDPLKMNQRFGSYSSSVMYVSKNIMRLYR